MNKLLIRLMLVLTIGIFSLGVAYIAVAAESATSSKSIILLNPLPVAQEIYCHSRVCDLKEMVLLFMYDLLRVIPIFSVLFIIVGAFRMISSQGNEEALVSAKKTIVWAVLGLVIAVMSFSIIAIVQNFISAGVNNY